MKVNKQVARKDIYERGLHVPDETTKSKERLDRSQPADKDDKVLIPAGSTYYWWKFRYSGKILSLTYPNRRQLTQNEWELFTYDFQDQQEVANDAEDGEALQGTIDALVELLDDRASELQGRLDNMPEGLQTGSEAGETLQGRIDACENASSELQGIDTDDFEEPTKQLADEQDEDDADETDEELKERRDEEFEQWLQGKKDEVTGVSLDV